MRTHLSFARLPGAITSATILATIASAAIAHAQSAGGTPQFPPPSANVSVYATGLDEPRGLTFGPDGNLYVAEAGHGGSMLQGPAGATSYGTCVPAAAGAPTAYAGYTGRISVITSTGNRWTLVSGLPSGGNQDGSSAVGPADVTFLNGSLYGLLDAGCNNGNRTIPSGIIAVAPNGTWSEYNLSTWAQQHPPAQPDTGAQSDYAPDGSWYSMTSANGKIVTVNPNGGQVVQLNTANAQIKEITDVSATYGHVVPTAMTFNNGNFYTCTLGEFPQTPGQQEVIQITPSGKTSVYAKGLTGCVSLAWGPDGNLYALDLFTSPAPTPGTGRVLRINKGAAPTPVATGLTFPTAMTFGPDGMLYVSNIGIVPMAGQIVKVNVNQAP